MIKIDLDNIDWNSLEVDGINHSDYPDFCDAFISFGLDKEGNELNEETLEYLTYEGKAYDIIMDKQLFIRD